jgi:uncharacterized protein YbbK (DUF523 family)
VTPRRSRPVDLPDHSCPLPAPFVAGDTCRLSGTRERVRVLRAESWEREGTVLVVISERTGGLRTVRPSRLVRLTKAGRPATRQFGD